MSIFSTDDTAADPTTGEDKSDIGDDSCFVTGEDPLVDNEGMPSDFRAGHRACYEDEGAGAPLTNGLADLHNQMWTKGQDMQSMKDELGQVPSLR